jgi:hypothetical protein
LGGGQLANLSADGVEISLPTGEQLVQVVPVLHGKRSVHRRRNMDALVSLIQLCANKFRFQN